MLQDGSHDGGVTFSVILVVKDAIDALESIAFPEIVDGSIHSTDGS
jgi:hypothetical protein